MSGTGVAITNPLVLYRSLVATQSIRPDPAQHRLGNDVDHFSDPSMSLIASFSITFTKALRESHRL